MDIQPCKLGGLRDGSDLHVQLDYRSGIALIMGKNWPAQILRRDNKPVNY
jgi:hypothetical protein